MLKSWCQSVIRYNVKNIKILIKKIMDIAYDENLTSCLYHTFNAFLIHSLTPWSGVLLEKLTGL
jgi:hypothetical protein